VKKNGAEKLQVKENFVFLHCLHAESGIKTAGKS